MFLKKNVFHQISLILEEGKKNAHDLNSHTAVSSDVEGLTNDGKIILRDGSIGVFSKTLKGTNQARKKPKLGKTSNGMQIEDMKDYLDNKKNLALDIVKANPHQNNKFFKDIKNFDSLINNLISTSTVNYFSLNEDEHIELEDQFNVLNDDLNKLLEDIYGNTDDAFKNQFSLIDGELICEEENSASESSTMKESLHENYGQNSYMKPEIKPS